MRIRTAHLKQVIDQLPVDAEGAMSADLWEDGQVRYLSFIVNKGYVDLESFMLSGWHTPIRFPDVEAGDE
jgi:hypothetical protein